MNTFSNLRGGGRIVLGLALGLAVAAGNPAHAADKIVLQLNWKHQAEYAGYYVAREKGWYADEGLEVEIRPAMPTDDMVALLVAGEADVIVEFMASALYEREHGGPIVNIAQPFKHTGLDLICRRDSGLRLLDDLRGKKIGHAPGHGETVELGALLAKLDINAKSSIDATSWNPKTDVRLVEFENAQYGITSGIVDCILWYSSKGLGVFESAGLRADQLIVFPFDGLGLGILGGGLWVLEKRLEDAIFVDAMARFVHVSMKGWRWAEDNQPETVSMVLKTMGDQSPQALLQQTQMMKAIINQAADSNGTLEARDYRRTVDILRDGMVLDKEPQNAWTSDITDRANLYAGDRFDRLLTDVSAWSKRFVLTLIDPRSTLTHICWFLLVLSMFMHNFTTLRILVVVSGFVSIANDIFLRFDYATMFWTVFLILPNLWHLFFAKVADAMAKLTVEEEDLWVSQLQGLSRKNCHKLFNSGQWAFAGGGEEIARYGHPISRVYYIYGGAIMYSRDDKIISRVEAPTFANLFSFLDMAPSFMVTNIEKGTRYWVIEVDVLRKLMHNNDDIGRSLDKVFCAQFRKYGRVMSNRILELEERLNSGKTGASIHKTADTKHASPAKRCGEVFAG